MPLQHVAAALPPWLLLHLWFTLSRILCNHIKSQRRHIIWSVSSFMQSRKSLLEEETGNKKVRYEILRLWICRHVCMGVSGCVCFFKTFFFLNGNEQKQTHTAAWAMKFNITCTLVVRLQSIMGHSLSILLYQIVSPPDTISCLSTCLCVSHQQMSWGSS